VLQPSVLGSVKLAGMSCSWNALPQALMTVRLSVVLKSHI